MCAGPAFATWQLEPEPYLANRTISFGAVTTTGLTAIEVFFADLPAPFDGGNGHSMWVGEPFLRSENGAVREPIPGWPNIWVAELQCVPLYLDWSAYEELHIYSEWVIPSAIYEIRAIPAGCAPDDPGNYSAPFVAYTASWTDLVGPFDAETQTWPWPDGSVDVSADVVAELDKFRSLLTAASKARTDLEPSHLDWCQCITDVTVVLDAFAGGHYPFAPNDPTPCP